MHIDAEWACLLYSLLPSPTSKGHAEYGHCGYHTFLPHQLAARGTWHTPSLPFSLRSVFNPVSLDYLDLEAAISQANCFPTVVASVKVAEGEFQVSLQITDENQDKNPSMVPSLWLSQI